MINVSCNWTNDERIRVIGMIGARYMGKTFSVSKNDLLGAVETITMVATKSSEFLEVNRMNIEEECQ